MANPLKLATFLTHRVTSFRVCHTPLETPASRDLRTFSAVLGRFCSMLQHHRFATSQPPTRGEVPPPGSRLGGWVVDSLRYHAEQLPDNRWLTGFSNSESVFFFSTSKLTSNGPMASGSGGAGLRVSPPFFMWANHSWNQPLKPKRFKNGKMVWFHTTILVKHFSM